MIYIPKYDKEQISKVERAINEVTGVDKDTYFCLNGRAVGLNRVARLAWIYMVYENTTIGVEDLANMLNRHHSGIVRSIAVVRKWLKSKEGYAFEKKLINEIDEKRKTF